MLATTVMSFESHQVRMFLLHNSQGQELKHCLHFSHNPSFPYLDYNITNATSSISSNSKSACPAPTIPRSPLSSPTTLASRNSALYDLCEFFRIPYTALKTYTFSVKPQHSLPFSSVLKIVLFLPLTSEWGETSHLFATHLFSIACWAGLLKTLWSFSRIFGLEPQNLAKASTPDYRKFNFYLGRSLPWTSSRFQSHYWTFFMSTSHF